MAAPVRYVTSSGISIAWSERGQGPPDLVFVPGFVSHQEVLWEEPRVARFFERLAGFSRLIMFDKREQGLSDRLGRPPALEETMDDLRAVLDAAGASRVTLFGISEGGPMALLFAATYPDRVERLILYGSYARLVATDGYPMGLPPAWLSAFERQVEQRWGSAVALRWFAPSLADDERMRAWWARLLRSGTSPRGAIELMRLYEQIDVRDILPSLRVPLLVLHRRDDQLVDVRQARDLAEHVRDARLVELDGADHVPFAGDADAIVDEIEAFVTGTRPQRAPDRILATVLFEDIVDSTRRAADLGDRRWRSLLDAHDAAVRDEVDRHGGQVVKTLGDGTLALFDGPARAVRGALAIRDAVHRLGLEIRAGVHTGEVERMDGDVGGIGVHIGARVAAASEPGEVLVSRTVNDLVVGSGLAFADRGEHELKGVPGSWQLFAATS